MWKSSLWSGATKALLCGFLFLSAESAIADNVFRMAFKDEAKPPLMGPKGDDSGVYLEMFSAAAEKIGYRLEVARLPKKRLYLLLEKGDLDFYPGSSFSAERSKFLTFLSNGLRTKEVLISRDKHPVVVDLKQISGRLLIDLGGSKTNIQRLYPKLTTYPVPSLDFEQSLTLMRLNRVDYYIADIEEVEHYSHNMGLNSYAEIGLQIHHDALGGWQPMYMGFSINSPLIKTVDNPSFEPKAPLSYTNTPLIAAKDSAAFKLHEALMLMQANGEITKIVDRYKSR